MAAKNLSSDDLEKNDFDPWGFDFNNVKIFYNNVKITSEILNISLKEGKYFKFNYQIFKVNTCEIRLFKDICFVKRRS